MEKLIFYPVIIFGALFGVYLIYMIVTDSHKEYTNKQKENCIQRGGTITEYHGGFTDWTCEGIKK